MNNTNCGRDNIFYRLGHEESGELLEILYGLEDVNKKDDKGLSYLHAATIAYNLPAIKVLLAKGADPNCEDNEGNTPLLYALGGINERNPEILKEFLRYGVNLSKVEGGITIKETILSFEDEELTKIIEETE